MVKSRLVRGKWTPKSRVSLAAAVCVSERNRLIKPNIALGLGLDSTTKKVAEYGGRKNGGNPPDFLLLTLFSGNRRKWCLGAQAVLPNL